MLLFSSMIYLKHDPYLLVDILLEKHINKFLLIGFDLKGNLLEVMYNLVDEETANVFHAMKCRKEMYKYLPRSL
jgi:hypothetical protein